MIMFKVVFHNLAGKAMADKLDPFISNDRAAFEVAC